MKLRRFLVVASLIVVCVSLSVAAAAPALKFTFTDVNAPGATQTDSYAVNNAGAIAGDYVDSSSVQHGMILAGKKLTKFDNKSCQTTGNATGSIAAFGVNKTNVVAGWCYSTTTGLAIGWTYAKGKYTMIKGPKGATQVEANGINDAGAVVGTYFDSTGNQNAFLLSKGKYTTLKPPAGATNTIVAWAISNKNVITVYGLNSSGGYTSGYTANNGKSYKKFAYSKAGTTGTVVHAVNTNGDVDGTYFDTNGLAHGVLLHGGKYYPFDDPKASNSTRADGLNDKLVIVGRYSPSDGTNHGFKATAK
jgi:probable HAF family extracellular repeat protein